MKSASRFRPCYGVSATAPTAASAALLAMLLGIPAQGAAVMEAARFYHQGLFDSSLARLEAVKSEGNLKRRDSLSLFQYQGMASARLGREPEAVACFGSLLGLDSLFQFPRNEDPAVLRAFSRAREARTAPSVLATPISASASLQNNPNPSAAPSVEPTAARDSLTPRPSSDVPATAETGPGILLASASPSSTSRSAESTDYRIPLSGPNPPDQPDHRAPPSIGFAMGALPLGTGWFARNKVKHGLVLGFLQAGGIALSIYASDIQSRAQRDAFEVENDEERATLEKWQWVQRVSISTAVGAYLFSLIAATGDR